MFSNCVTETICFVIKRASTAVTTFRLVSVLILDSINVWAIESDKRTKQQGARILSVCISLYASASFHLLCTQSRMENHNFSTAENVGTEWASVAFEIANKKRIFINFEHDFPYLQSFGLYVSYVECCNGSIWFTVIVINGFHVFFVSFCIFQSNHLENCESVCLRFSIYPIYFIFARKLVRISTKFPGSMLIYKLLDSKSTSQR